MTDPADASTDRDVAVSATAAITGRRTRRGVRQSLATQGFLQLGSLAATVLLARLLTPSEFGIVALSQSLLGAIGFLALSGVSAAIVTRQDAIALAASTYFWVTACLGVVVILLVIAVAPAITGLLGQPQAAPYVVVLSFSFYLALLALVPNALMQREFRFGWYNAAVVSGGATYFALEVLLAWLDFGAWSVVLGQVAGSVVALAVAVMGARWLPKWNMSISLLRSDASITTGLSLGQLLSYLQKNLDYWAVSAFVGGPALGVYYIAYVMPNIVRLRLTTVVGQVMLPSYARCSSLEEAASLWRRTVPAMLGLGFPVLVGLIVVAESSVTVFLGPQWVSAIEPMRILTLAALIDLVLASIGPLAMARREIRRHLAVLAVRASSTALFVVIAGIVWHSISAMAWAIVASAAVTLVIQECHLSRRMHVGLVSIPGSVSGYCALSLVMAVAVVLVRQPLPAETPAVGRLAVEVCVGAAIYFLFGWLTMPGLLRPVVRDARQLLLGR